MWPLACGPWPINFGYGYQKFREIDTAR